MALWGIRWLAAAVPICGCGKLRNLTREECQPTPQPPRQPLRTLYAAGVPPDELYPVIDVSDWDIVADETSGAEEKYWLVEPGTGRRWLFKSVTIKDGHVHGEDWAEKAVAQLAARLGVPAARVEMAALPTAQGCISADLRPLGHELQPGQVLLEERKAPGYVHAKGNVHLGHSLENIQRVLEGAKPPPGCELPFEATAFEVFSGYLVLDAWVANRDRHDNNWAVLRPIAQSADPLRLCGSYDHASSLGFNVTDEERSRRLAEQTLINQWCGRGYAVRFERGPDQRHLTLVDLAVQALRRCSDSAREHWLQQLEGVDQDEVRGIVARVPRMSDPARRFAEEVLGVNRRRVLDACA